MVGVPRERRGFGREEVCVPGLLVKGAAQRSILSPLRVGPVSVTLGAKRLEALRCKRRQAPKWDNVILLAAAPFIEHLAAHGAAIVVLRQKLFLLRLAWGTALGTQQFLKD